MNCWVIKAFKTDITDNLQLASFQIFTQSTLGAHTEYVVQYRT